MSEEIKNEEIDVDKKINELLDDPLIKTEEEKKFLKNIGESLKKGEVPVDLIFNKTNEALSKLDEIKNNHPQFESFVKHYQNKINDAMAEMMQTLKKEKDGE